MILFDYMLWWVKWNDVEANSVDPEQSDLSTHYLSVTICPSI